MNLQRADAIIPAAPRRPDRSEVWPMAARSRQDRHPATGARWRNVNVPGEPSTRTRAWPTARTATAPVQGKRVAGDRRRQLGRGSGHRPGRRGGPRHRHRVRPNCAPTPCWSEKAQKPAQRHRPPTPRPPEITGADQQGQPASSTRTAPRASKPMVPLEGVFVQIGLVPNTEFLRGTVEL